MVNKTQMRAVEMQRRIRMAVAALKAVERCLVLELDEAVGLSPDNMADRIRENVKASLTRN